MSVKKGGSLRVSKERRGTQNDWRQQNKRKTHDKKKGRREVRHSAISQGAQEFCYPSGGEPPFSETPTKNCPVNARQCPASAHSVDVLAPITEKPRRRGMHALHSHEITVGLDRWLFGEEIRVFVFKYGEPHVEGWSWRDLMEIVWFAGDARSCMAGAMGISVFRTLLIGEYSGK